MQNPTWHDLKIWPIFFKDTFKGIKNFEYRVNDRDYKKGDYLVLKEWDPKTEHYSGRQLTRKIIYILEGHLELPVDMVILGIGRECEFGELCSPTSKKCDETCPLFKGEIQ